MSVLVVIDFGRDSFGAGGIVDPVAVLRHHVPVIESVGHQQSGFHGFHVIEVVASCPEVIVVSCGAVHALCHFGVADGFVVVGSFGFVPAVDEIVEHIDIFAQVSSGERTKPLER